MKQWKRSVLAAFMTLLLALQPLAPVLPGSMQQVYAETATFSQFWFQDEAGNWKVKDQNGNLVKNAWLCDDAVAANGKDIWYLLDANGNMVTAGLVQDKTGNFYSLEMNHNGYFGMLRYRSQLYDGVNLVLEGTHNNHFGKILNADGLAALQAKYGVYRIEIDNSNCVYTSSFLQGAAGGPGAGGSVGPGGGIGGGGGSSSGGSSGGHPDIIDPNEDWYEDGAWEDYEDHSVSYGANHFTNGNASKMSAQQTAEVKAAIEAFKEAHLTEDMSDFEIELEIVAWLVGNCEYEVGENWANATAYSCIINGKAQCAGYADAFLQTAKACGLEVRYVYNKTHAWNLVKIDGDWYHVDVTWEDPGSNHYGDGNLRNMYINLEDARIARISHHFDWKPTSIKANGYKYGTRVIQKYLEEGVIDTSLGISYREELEQFYETLEKEDPSSIITYSNVNETANEIIAFIAKRIEERQDSYRFAVRYGEQFKANVTGDWTKLKNIRTQIKEKVEAAINSRYSEVLENKIKVTLFSEREIDDLYYSYEHASLRYKPGQGLMVPYTVHLMWRGQEIATQTGVAEKNTSVEIAYPENYSYLNYKDGYQILKGKGRFAGKSFSVTGREPLEMRVELRDETLTNYTVIYCEVGNGNRVFETVSGEGKIGATITPEEKKFDGYIMIDEIQPFVLTHNVNRIYIYYAEAANYTIQYICDTDGEILETLHETGRMNAYITIPKLSFDEHEHVKGGGVQLRLDEKEKLFEVHYRRLPKQFSYTVVYVDTDGNELGRETKYGQENMSIQLKPKYFAGYELLEGQKLNHQLTADKQEYYLEYGALCTYEVQCVAVVNGQEAVIHSRSGTAVKGSSVQIQRDDHMIDGLRYVRGAGVVRITENGQCVKIYYEPIKADIASASSAERK